MIQIRNVPEDFHRRLKARAAQECLSLSDLLLAEARRPSARLCVPPADAVRAERDR